MRSGTVLWRLFLWCVSAGLLYSCGGGLTDEEQWAITWVRKHGVKIDDWQAGEITENFDLEAWKAEGRAKPNAEEVIVRLLTRHDPHVEEVLLYGGLAVVGTERSVGVLVDLARDGSSGRRMNALFALGEIGHPKAFPVVADRFLHDDDMNCRVNAALALGKIGDPRGIDLIDKVLDGVRIRQERAAHETDLTDVKFLRWACEKALSDLRKMTSGEK